MRTAPSGRPSLEEEAVSGSRGTQQARPGHHAADGLDRAGRRARAGYDLEELVVTPAGRRTWSGWSSTATRASTWTTSPRSAARSPRCSTRHDDGDGPSPYSLEVTSPGVDRPLTDAAALAAQRRPAGQGRRRPGGDADAVHRPGHRRRRRPGSRWPSDGEGASRRVEDQRPGRRPGATFTRRNWAPAGSQVEFGPRPTNDGRRRRRRRPTRPRTSSTDEEEQ